MLFFSNGKIENKCYKWCFIRFLHFLFLSSWARNTRPAKNSSFAGNIHDLHISCKILQYLVIKWCRGINWTQNHTVVFKKNSKFLIIIYDSVSTNLQIWQNAIAKKRIAHSLVTKTRHTILHTNNCKDD